MRIRTIKPEFWTDKKVSSLSYLSRLLFIGLWNHADDEGRFRADPRIIKGCLFPVDDLTEIQALAGGLTELSVKGLIRTYEIGDEKYGDIPNFKSHQVINRPTKSRIPKFSDISVSPHGVLPDGSGSGSGSGKGTLLSPSGDECEGLRELWNTTCPTLPKVKEMTKARRQKVKIRLTERPLADWKAVFEKIESSDFCRGGGPSHWVASFDWIIANTDNAVKVTEGKYDNRTAKTTSLPGRKIPPPGYGITPRRISVPAGGVGTGKGSDVSADASEGADLLERHLVGDDGGAGGVPEGSGDGRKDEPAKSDNGK